MIFIEIKQIIQDHTQKQLKITKSDTEFMYFIFKNTILKQDSFISIYQFLQETYIIDVQLEIYAEPDFLVDLQEQIDPDKTFQNSLQIDLDNFKEGIHDEYKSFLQHLIQNKILQTCQKISLEKIRSYYLNKNQSSFAIYLYFQKKNFIVECGKHYGFQFLLYKKDQNNQRQQHSPYAVDINKQCNYQFLMMKLRICNNYKKKYINSTCVYKQTFDLLKCKNDEEFLSNFDIDYQIFNKFND